MSRAALIESGIVQQIAVGDPGDPWVACGDDVQIGWSYDGTTFAAPPAPPEPTPAELAATLSLSRTKFFLALASKLNLGLSDPLPDAYVIQQIINDQAQPTPVIPSAYAQQARLLMASAQIFYRADEAKPILEAVSAILGITTSELDTMFIENQ